MNLKTMVFASLFAALMSIGGYIFLPIGPVPIVLSNFFVLLAGLSLGPRWGTLSVLIYLSLGAMGMPVFAGGKSGLAHIIGPTGGYLIGFLLAAWVCGMFCQNKVLANQKANYVIGALSGALVIYLPGLAWLHYVTKMSWSKTVVVGCFPFLPGDFLKAIAAAVIAVKLKDIINPDKVLAV